MRERHYIDPFTADNNGCDHQMVEKEMCSADVGVCQGKTCPTMINLLNIMEQEVLKMLPLTGFLMTPVQLQSGQTGQPVLWHVALDLGPGLGGSSTGWEGRSARMWRL